MSRRTEQVAELVRELLSKQFIQDLSEAQGIVTIVDVIVSADLKNADVYIAVLDKEKVDSVMKMLEAKKKDYQHYLGRNLNMRYTPRLSFKIDQSQEDINKVEELLKEIKDDA